jgi:hypothetical protein
MAVDPDALDDIQKIRNLMDNARKAGMADLVIKCQRRIATIGGQKFDPGIEREFWTALLAAEEIATERNGKSTRLSRTRQKIKRVGVMQTVSDLALKSTKSEGFEMLTSDGKSELTAEAIVLRHPDLFAPEVVASAKRKLADIDR